MKQSQYKVAANDINKPSLVVLVSLFIPISLACGFAFYLLTMPLSGSSVSVTDSNTIEHLYLIYLPFISK